MALRADFQYLVHGIYPACSRGGHCPLKENFWCAQALGARRRRRDSSTGTSTAARPRSLRSWRAQRRCASSRRPSSPTSAPSSPGSTWPSPSAPSPPPCSALSASQTPPSTRPRSVVSHLAALHLCLRIMIIIILKAPCSSCQKARCICRQAAVQNPSPCWTRQIQARPNQPWAGCSVCNTATPPAGDGVLKI